MKIRDWYFQGWERRESGGKSALVYTGEYYTLPKGAKPPVLALATGLTVLYLAVALFPSAGGMWRIAAIPQLLELLPLIYLVIGAICLLRVKGPLTFRDWYASWQRLEKAALGSLVFTVLMAGTEIVYLILFPTEGALARELLYLAGELGCAALSTTLYLFIHKHPCTQSREGSQKE